MKHDSAAAASVGLVTRHGVLFPGVGLHGAGSNVGARLSFSPRAPALPLRLDP
jgi:hypothetical protein